MRRNITNGKSEHRSIILKYRKSLIGMMVILMMLLLGGCSLAKENGGVEALEGRNQDRLIGVFITNKYLDLKEKIYATIDKKESNDPVDWVISFDGIEGTNFFHVEFQNEGEEPFSMVFTDGICDVNTHYKTMDEGESVELTGTLYTIVSNKEIVFYSNPVYQTAEGDIYVIPGTGGALDASSMGISMTESVEEEWTVTEGKEKQSGKIKVTINYALSYKPLYIRVHQMGIDNQVIKTEEYDAGTLPEYLILENNAAYFLVETEWDNPEQEGYVTRELYEREEEGSTYIETFVVTENGRLEKQSTTIAFAEYENMRN